MIRDVLDRAGPIASVARRGPLEEELAAEHFPPNPEAVLDRDPSDMRVRAPAREESSATVRGGATESP